jgi:hypothetical protein
MDADLIVDFKDLTPEGGIIQMRVWKVPEPVPPSPHTFKYRLYYGIRGERIVGFDNGRGKGDHCHLDGREQPYRFVGVEQLIEDFITEVERRRKP